MPPIELRGATSPWHNLSVETRLAGSTPRALPLLAETRQAASLQGISLSVPALDAGYLGAGYNDEIKL